VKTGYPLPAALTAFAEREWQNPFVQEFCRTERPDYRPAA
jgi:hypothetical protein